MRYISWKRVWLVLIALLISAFWWFPIPSFPDSYGLRVYSNDSALLGYRLSKEGEWRFKSAKQLPDTYLKTLIWQEDRYFFYHPGINPISLIRATWVNLKAGKVKQGGSTLTMQLSRMLLRNRKRSLWNKFREIWISLCLEARHSKNEILQHYTSMVPMGSNVVGLKAGSQLYFGNRAEHLTYAQSALLTLLPNHPGHIYPGRNMDRLLGRRNRLLVGLAQAGEMPAQFLPAALQEPLPVGKLLIKELAPHFVDACVKQEPKGGDFYTTIDHKVQGLALSKLEEYMNRLSSQQVSNGAVMVIGRESHEVLAWVGNTSKSVDGQSIDMLDKPRSYGSLLKPFLYGFCLSEGLLLPHQWVEDLPRQFGSYHPKNASGRHVGLLPASAALAGSLNVTAVDWLYQFGYERFHLLCREAGLTDLTQPAGHYGLSIILGGGEVRPSQIAGLYLSLANEGKEVNMNTGLKEWKFSLSKLSPSAAYYTHMALTESRRPNEQGEWVQHGSGTMVSWKTGTSFGARDAWCAGFSKSHVVLVWLGNASGLGRPGLSGLHSAAPLFFELINRLEAQAELESEMLPPGSKQVSTCGLTGFPKGPYCPKSKQVLTDAKQLSMGVCRYHVKSAGTLSHASGEPVEAVSLNMSPLLSYYTGKAGLFDFINSNSQTEDRKSAPVFLYPRGRVVLSIPKHYKETFFIAEAIPGDRAELLYWHLNDRYLGSTHRMPHQMKIAAPEGNYRLKVINEKGLEQIVSFVIQ